MEDNLVKVTHFFHIFLEKVEPKSYTLHFFVNIWTASSKLVTKSGFYLKNCSVTNVIGGKLNKELNIFLMYSKFSKRDETYILTY